MRDLIWTIIGVWFVYKIYTEVISPFLNRNNTTNQTKSSQYNQAAEPANQKETKKQNLDGLGEYVDYEEIKD
jgi:hypothetical protein